MTNETFPQIRRRPDGSIDTDHYITHGRTLRSEAAHDMAATLAKPAPAAQAPRRTGLFSAFLGKPGAA